MGIRGQSYTSWKQSDTYGELVKAPYVKAMRKKDWATALHIAAKFDRRKTALVLINNGADRNAMDCHGMNDCGYYEKTVDGKKVVGGVIPYSYEHYLKNARDWATNKFQGAAKLIDDDEYRLFHVSYADKPLRGRDWEVG